MIIIPTNSHSRLLSLEYLHMNKTTMAAYLLHFMIPSGMRKCRMKQIPWKMKAGFVSFKRFT